MWRGGVPPTNFDAMGQDYCCCCSCTLGVIFRPQGRINDTHARYFPSANINCNLLTEVCVSVRILAIHRAVSVGGTVSAYCYG